MTERLAGQKVVPVPSEVAVFDDPIANDARRRSARLRWRAEIKEEVIVRLPKHTRKSNGKRFLETGDKRTAEAVGDALATKSTRRIERSKKLVKNQVIEFKVDSVTLAGTCLPSRTLLPQSWFRRDSLEVAPALLGKILRKDGIELRITEVEAYREGDSACHARVGLTPRTAPLFGPPGRCYVYLCYGIHSMLNIITNQEQQGAAVLIRAAEPVTGLPQIQANRKMVSDKPILLTGPGKVGAALGLTVDWTTHPVFEPGGLEILDGPPPASILHGPRVGIDYAAPEDIAALWRFAAGDTPWVSQRKTLTAMLP